MKKELKEQVIAAIKANMAEYPNFYITDIAGLNAEDTSKLRRDCFNEGIKLTVVKNTLFHKVIKDAQIPPWCSLACQAPHWQMLAASASSK